jgi:hypothetical protein
MKTLQKFIDDGLPVGALVEGEISGDILQYLYPKRNGGQFYDFRFGDEAWFEFSNMEYKPTTAYDSDIDPETLPIPEPFWTGWFVLDRIKREITKIEPCGDGFDLYFYDNCIVYSSICQPCLP